MPIIGDITCLRIDNLCWQASHTCLLSYQQHEPQHCRYRVSHAHIRKANRQRSVRLSVIFLFELFAVFRSSFTSFRPKYVCLRFIVTITVSIIFLPDLSTSSGFHCSNFITLERRNSSSGERLTAYLHDNSSFDIHQSENTEQDEKNWKGKTITKKCASICTIITWRQLYKYHVSLPTTFFLAKAYRRNDHVEDQHLDTQGCFDQIIATINVQSLKHVDNIWPSAANLLSSQRHEKQWNQNKHCNTSFEHLFSHSRMSNHWLWPVQQRYISLIVARELHNKQTTCDQFSSTSSLSSLKQEAADETKTNMSRHQRFTLSRHQQERPQSTMDVHQCDKFGSAPTNSSIFESSNTYTKKKQWQQTRAKETNMSRPKSIFRSSRHQRRPQTFKLRMSKHVACSGLQTTNQNLKAPFEPKKEQAVRTKTRINHVSTYNFKPWTTNFKPTLSGHDDSPLCMPGRKPKPTLDDRQQSFATLVDTNHNSSTRSKANLVA